MKKLLQNRNIVYLWWARTFSRFGDALESLALMYLVYDLTGSGLAMGTTMLFSILPNVLISPFAGVVVDRYNKNRIMFISEMVRTLVILIIPALMLMGKIQVWHIYTISVVVSIAESFFEPCNGATFKLVVGNEDLPLVNSVVTTSNNIARIIGYSLSGIIIAFYGKEIIFAFDAFTFFMSALASLAIRIPDTVKQKIESYSEFFDEIANGFKYILSQKLIIVILLVIIIVQFIGAPIGLFVPLIIENVLRIGTAWAGTLLTINIVGTIIGNLIFPIVNKTSLKLSHFYFYSLILIGLFIGFAGFFSSIVTYSALFFVVGVLGSILGISSFTKIQQLVSNDFIGRVFAFSNIALLVANPLSSTIFGALADYVYIPTIFKYLSIICVVAGVTSYLMVNKAERATSELSAENASAT